MIEPGKVYRTPWEPSGLFRVTRVDTSRGSHGEAAFGYFVGDHPKGYKDGQVGAYPCHELEGREASG